MQYIADLHLHSRYSRATSPDLNIAGLYKGAKIKGIDIIGTGDFTFPQYVREMEQNLESVGGGLYRFVGRDAPMGRLYDGKREPLFLITTEISNIYKRGGKARRVHTCIWAPGLDEVKELNRQLGKIGNIKADGRPILGMDAADTAKLIWSVSPDFIIIPAHAWTPWFAVFGSKSGFDSIEECFGDLTPHIYAIETGLSSDPPMNRRLSQLDSVCLVSNSDAHSLPNLGREATVFELEKPTIQNIRDALNIKDRHAGAKPADSAGEAIASSMGSIGRPSASLQNDNKRLNRVAYTIEFYPQEGKYHWDGHLPCRVSMAPAETKKHKGLCPKCKKPLTLGVEYRVEELADRVEPKKNGDYKYIVPLAEIIADALDQGKQSKRVQAAYDALIKEFGNEFAILLEVPIDNLDAFGLPELSEGVRRARQGEIYIEPGYDGRYGVVKVFKPHEQASARKRQNSLF